MQGCLSCSAEEGQRIRRWGPVYSRNARLGCLCADDPEADSYDSYGFQHQDEFPNLTVNVVKRKEALGIGQKPMLGGLDGCKLRLQRTARIEEGKRRKESRVN